MSLPCIHVIALSDIHASDLKSGRLVARLLQCGFDGPSAMALVSDGRAGTGRWSYLAREASKAQTLKQARREDLLSLKRQPQQTPPDLLDPPPFCGGDLVLLAYDAADQLETLPDLGRLNLAGETWPDLVIARYEQLWVLDHLLNRLILLAECPDRLAAEVTKAEHALQAPDHPLPMRLGESFAPETSPKAHQERVAACVRRIGEGEIFQANIAQGWRGKLCVGVRPLDAFRALLLQSPAPFNAYVAFEGGALISNSPEQFLSLKEGVVQTAPIKGTRPRGKTVSEDQSLAEDLQSSLKDQAENLMIVDLMRNDLGRVCDFGTIKVPKLFALESFSNVHHLVSYVTGTLGPGRDAVDLLLASFPPGSITGAPKIQAMCVIRALEASPRGPFCGSLALIGSDGSLQSSVLIRSLALLKDRDGQWQFRAAAGGGITADSDPIEETRETDAKIARLKALLSPSGGSHA